MYVCGGDDKVLKMTSFECYGSSIDVAIILWVIKHCFTQEFII